MNCWKCTRCGEVEWPSSERDHADRLPKFWWVGGLPCGTINAGVWPATRQVVLCPPCRRHIEDAWPTRQADPLLEALLDEEEAIARARANPQRDEAQTGRQGSEGSA